MLFSLYSILAIQASRSNLLIAMRSHYCTRHPYKVTGSTSRGKIVVPEERFLVPKDPILQAALHVVTETPCVRLFMHRLIRAIVRVMIVRLCCRMFLGGRMYSYLDPIR